MSGLLRLLPALAPIAGGAAVLLWRYHETRTPVNAAKIVVPPLAMATGFGMFVVPAMQVPWSWAAAAFALGASTLAIPLMRSSRLERSGDQVMLRRSNYFLAILLGLLALRIALHDWVGRYLSAPQTAAVFFVLAFGMIVRWRVAMYRRYRALVDGVADPVPPDLAQE